MKRLLILAFLNIMILCPLLGSNDHPITLWNKYKTLFIIVAFFFLLIVIIVTALISNITQKRVILKKLLKRDAQLYRISNNLVNGFIYQVDIGIAGNERKFTYISNNTFQILGISNDRIYKDAFELYRLLHPDDLIKLQELEKEAFENKKILIFDGRIILENGTTKWFQLTSIPHKSENGHILWDGLAMDIGHLKKIESDLIIAKDKAEESTKLIASFLTNLGHEIRTPMNGILGFMDLLRVKDIPLTDQEIYITNYKLSALRFLNTLDDIVLMSEIEADRTTLNRNKTNIPFLMDQLLSTFQKEANDKGLDLIWNKPDPIELDTFETDSEKLIIIFSKLIQNSIKFTKEGFVEFGYNKEDDHYHFYVKDTGKGIPEHVFDSVFESFIQADMNITRVHEGMGLGLSIAKALIEKLGGNIWIESVENRFSIFHFTLK